MTEENIAECLQIYKHYSYVLHPYLDFITVTALRVLEILTHDTYDGHPLNILDYNFH